MNAEASLAADGGVEQGALGNQMGVMSCDAATGKAGSPREEEEYLDEGSRLLAQSVVVLQLHRHRLVAVQRRHLHVCGVVHVDGAEEVRRSEAFGGENKTKMNE